MWSWRPLADYVLQNCDIPKNEARFWGSNDGQKVSADTAIMIADTLEGLILSGETAKYAKTYEETLAMLPERDCFLCGGTGIRNDKVKHGKCNACNGTGKEKDFRTHYPFTVENVQEFASFCRTSGGFEIW